MILFNSHDEEIRLKDLVDSKWKDKKIVFDGTSLVSSGFALPETVCNLLGAVCANRGLGGGSIGMAGLGNEFYFRERVSNYDVDADALCIEIDANGTVGGSIDDTDESSWYGKYCNYLRCVREQFPTIPIFLLSDWNVRSGENAVTSGRKRALEFSNATRELSAVYGCVHIDLSTLCQYHQVNQKSALAFSRNGSEDHQRKEMAEKYLYPFIADVIDKYTPIEGDNETAISISANTLSVKVGETKTLKATLAPTQTIWQTNAWASSDKTIALACGGDITGKAVGTATITVTSRHGRTATCQVTVTAE